MTTNKVGEKENVKFEDQESKKQANMLKSFMRTVQHYFGCWEKIFQGVSDSRNQKLVTYSLTGLLFTGIRMYMFRLGARREINHELRGSIVSEKKFKTLFGTEEIPDGDTPSYGFKRINPEGVQAIVSKIVNAANCFVHGYA
ncbi:MAG: hypothetical protein MUO76_15240 [Anaerolineaceae bacterium]|nr:hypothetical protein [Anaerolineaceae bacterium]